LILLLLNISVISKEGSPDKNILILYSFNPTTPAYQVITEGIRTKLYEAFGDSYTLHMEYLETERYPKNGYPAERFELYNQKYQDVELDLLICVGIDPVETIRAHASKHLLGLPAITIDYDFSEIDYHIETTLNARTAEIQFRVNASKSISTALSLFPGTRSVYFICGISRSDRLMYSISKKAARQIDPGIDVKFLDSLSMDEVLHKVRNLPENSLIFVPNFNIDIKRVAYYNPESIRLISKAANAPVFNLTDMGFGQGAIGGYLLSFEKVGLLGGDIALKILNGDDPNSIIIRENDCYEYLFDDRELKRWGLDGSELLPKGSRIRFEEVSFLDRYKLFIIAGILFLVLQSLLIINLVRLNRKQKLITQQLIDSENRYRELVREDRVLRLGQLTAALSHELNQPLTAILSTAQAGLRFIDSGKADPELLKEILQNIVEDDKRTANILSSIRGMMKLEKKEKEKVNLNALIDELITIYKSEATLMRVRLSVNLTEKPVYVIADGIQIQQVMLNFISNAAQAADMAKAKNRNIIISEIINNEDVTVSVRDFGDGITDPVADILFKPFRTTKKEGLGIGLAISKSIIDDHHGKIWAENMPDGGANFAFSLKIVKDGKG
jgi:signal transduction histidine kinase